MTKTGTDARKALAPALGAGAALAAMLFASRLPATLDFILPRRAGWALFSLAHEALSRPGPRRVFIAAVSLLLLGAVARFVWLAVSAVRGRKWTPALFLTRGFVLALIVLLLRWSFSVWFEVSQKVWFPFGSMDPLEPLAHLLFCSLVVFVAMTAALSCLSSGPSPLRSLLSWAGVNALAGFLAFSVYGTWAPDATQVESRRLFVVLTEEEGRPGQAAYDLPLAPAPRPPSGAGRLVSLRALYERQAKLMDAAGLRSALMLGVKHGDDLARTLLLEHLSSAPPSPEALGALGALADETVHRIGSMGASRIALAYAHLGDPDQALVWAKRGEAAPRGIPAGLLGLTAGGALKPGRISGRVAGPRPLKVALYRKPDPVAPYLLDAAGLVASAEPDAKGRFSFSGLAEGRYYLAFAFAVPKGELRVAGHRGDIVLDPRETSRELPVLTVK